MSDARRPGECVDCAALPYPPVLPWTADGPVPADDPTPDRRGAAQAQVCHPPRGPPEGPEGPCA
jgi:hypothetical protein